MMNWYERVFFFGYGVTTGGGAHVLLGHLLLEFGLPDISIFADVNEELLGKDLVEYGEVPMKVGFIATPIVLFFMAVFSSHGQDLKKTLDE